MASPEAMQEWKANPVTIDVMALLENEKKRIMELMGNGFFLQLDSKDATFANIAKQVGVIEGIDKVFELLEEDENE